MNTPENVCPTCQQLVAYEAFTEAGRKSEPEDAKFSRFEVIDDTGRVIVHYGEVKLSYQDNNRTLKVFLKGSVKGDTNANQ